MADWYVSSVNYAALAAWAASTPYTVGQIIKPLTVPANTAYVYRCTVAGTSGSSEPAWTGASGNNSTITSGGATFQNVTGQSTYGWAAAAGTLYTMSGSVGSRIANGDRAFIGSDHSEAFTGFQTYQFGSSGFGSPIQVLSVNRAGSTPPVVADLQPGASIAASGANPLILDGNQPTLFQGITFLMSGTSDIRIGSNTGRPQTFKDCALKITGAGSTSRILTATTIKVIFDNTTVQFSNTAQCFSGSGTGAFFELVWINTPSAIQGATIPTTLFQTSAGGYTQNFTCRGVDLSAITGNLLAGTSVPWNGKLLLESCRIASGVTRYLPFSLPGGANEDVELINCYDGTNVINERYTPAGTITTDRTTALSGGAQDDIGNYSIKLASNARSDYFAYPLDCFAFDVENTATGSSKTATVEIISSATLNNNDIRLLLEYMGTSGNPIASFVDSLPSTLTAAAALSSSSATWNSPPSTPQKQLLQVTFTPQRAGRVRGLVRLGKISSTVWVNPQIAIA